MNIKPHCFSQSSFKSPPQLFAPVYTWVWNAPVTQEGIDHRLDDMAGRNIRAFYVLPEPKHFRPSSMTTALEPEYLSDDFFDLIAYTSKAAQKRGMTLWLYDEGGWPSGSACGQVVRNNPTLAQKIIRQEKITLSAGDILHESEDVAAAFTTGLRRVPLPFKAPAEIDLLVYRLSRTGTPDLLNPLATEEFIRITHEGYKKAVRDDVSGHFFAAFTDEPTVRYPAYPNDPEGFTLRYGYPLADRLPALFDDNDMGEDGIAVRQDYCDYYSAEIASAYFGKLREWCAANGILSSGHLNGDDNYLTCHTHGGHMPRLLRCFDIPAVDAIWRQIHPSDDSENGFFPRFASSAAAQNGSVLAASESFAVYGAGLTYEEMRWALFFQAVRGINMFNFMVISYGNHEFTASQERPCFQAEMPGSGDITSFNDFTSRLSYMAAVGKASNHTALYYPIRDIWAGGDTAVTAANDFDDMGRNLERLQCGFDIIDDDILRSAAMENGYFTIGSAVYDTIVLPECRYMPPDVRRRLIEFEELGGQLFLNCAAVTPAVKIDPLLKSLRSSRRKTEDGDVIYIIYNESAEPVETEITFAPDNINNIDNHDYLGRSYNLSEESNFIDLNEKGNVHVVYELDPFDGNIYRSSFRVRLSLGGGEGRIFLITAKKLETNQRYSAGEIYTTVNSFEAKSLRRFQLTTDGIRSINLDEKPHTLTAGDWRETFGEDFSGDVMYETFIECGNDDFILDLGVIKHACEAFLDGFSLGIRCMSPYTYFVPGIKRTTPSKLQIRVSNTAANEYISKDANEMFSSAQIGPYHARTLEFERDTLGSGLIGPVTLRRIITQQVGRSQ